MAQSDIDISENLYDILECEPNATQAELKRAYQSLILRHHPDKSGKESDDFVKINQAWNVLRDEQLRKKYDAERGQEEYNGTSIVHDTVTIKDFIKIAEDNDYLYHSCRCGGVYVIPKNFNEDCLLGCDECSLNIHFLPK